MAWSSARWSRRTATGTAPPSAPAAALRGGASRLAVATAAEAEELRLHFPEVPILVMGALTSDELRTALAARADVAVWREGFRDACSRIAEDLGRPARVHVKHDSGMGRLGERDPDDADRARPRLRRGPASGGRRRLDPLRDRGRGGRPLLRRAARRASRRSPRRSGELAPDCIGPRGQQRRDVARSGDALRHGPLRDRHLRARSLRARPRRARTSSRRSSCTPTSPTSSASSAGRAPDTGGPGTRRRTPGSACSRSATATGSGAASPTTREVLVGGRRYPLVGTVSMDNITIDLGPETEVEPGAPAVLIGAQGSERILAEEVAARLDTINYEVTCGISAAGASRGDRVSAVDSTTRSPAPRRSRRPARALRGAPQSASGSSAARSATRSSSERSPTSTWRWSAAARRRPPARSPGWRAARLRSSPRSSRPGERSRPTDGWHVDVSGLRGGVDRGRSRAPATSPSNAVAVPLGGGDPVDPDGGIADAEARILRAASEPSFEDDPLRLLRAGRLGASLGLSLDPGTAELARRDADRAADPAGERQFAELRRHRRRRPEPIARPRADGGAGRAAGRAARARGAPRRRPEPQPPSRRARPHDRGARGVARRRGRRLGLRRRPRRRGGGVPRRAARRRAHPAGRAALRGALPRPRQARDPGGGRRLRHLHRPRRGRGADHRLDLPAAAHQPRAQRAPPGARSPPPAARVPDPRAAAARGAPSTTTSSPPSRWRPTSRCSPSPTVSPPAARARWPARRWSRRTSTSPARCSREALAWHREGTPRPPLIGGRAGGGARAVARARDGPAARGASRRGLHGRDHQPLAGARASPAAPLARRMGIAFAPRWRSPTASSAASSPASIPSETIDSDERTVAFMDINPATRGPRAGRARGSTRRT